MPNAADIIANIKLNAAGMGADVTKAKGHLKRLGEGIAALEAPARRTLMVLGAMVGLVAREYAKAETANEGLRAALAATGNEVENNYQRMTEFSEALANSTVLTQRESKELITLALNLGVSARQATEAVKGGVGLGKALFGGDSQQGVRAFSEAIQGNFRELERIIPGVRNATSDTQKLAAVNEKAAAGLKEANAASKTFGGAMKILQKNAEEAGESLGGAFAPDLLKIANVLQNVLDKFNALTPQQKQSIVRWVELAAAGAATIIVLNKVGGALSLLAAHPIVALLIAAGAAFAYMAGEGETAADRIASGFGKMGVAAEGFAETVGDASLKMLNFAVATLALFHGYSWEEAWKKIEEDQTRHEQTMFAEAERARLKRSKQIDQTVNAEKEGLRKLGALMSDADSVWKALQMKIMEAGKASAAGAAKGVTGAGAPLPGAAGEIQKAKAQGGGNAPGGAGMLEGMNQEAKAKTDQAHKLALQLNGAIAATKKAEEHRRQLLEAEKRLVIVDASGMEFSDNPAALTRVRKELKGSNAEAVASARAKQADLTEAYRKAAGIDPLSADPAKLAQRLGRAKKEAAKADQQYSTLRKRRDKLDAMLGVDTGSESRGDIQKRLRDELDTTTDPKRKAAIAEQLEVQSAIQQEAVTRNNAHAQVARGGRDAPVRPFDPDSLAAQIGNAKAAQRDLSTQHSGPLHRVEMQQQHTAELAEAMRRHSKGREGFVESADDRQDKQFGGVVKDFKEGVKDLSGAAETIARSKQLYTVH